jgi:hypothetical protein
MGTLASESAASGSAAVQLRLGSSDGPHRKQAAASSAHSWQTAVAGGIAGATAKTFTAPLGRLTILYQVLYQCTVSAVGPVWKARVAYSAAGSLACVAVAVPAVTLAACGIQWPSNLFALRVQSSLLELACCH